ncbi:cytochrome c biogenesis protein CcsA, partial [bacterium]|nr:cytochrome c biogenesis protein CcsA [candidate division CSSED10-310 bacterium]
VTCFLGYAAFAIAFFAGLMRFIGPRMASWNVPERLENIDLIMYRTVIVGFLMLTLGIISGAAWAYNAWGRYWGWDPKEVSSLVTWFVYAIFLHARVTRGWGGTRLAWLSVIGFLFVVFTFLGVNYLSIFKGLHSYI